MNIIITKYVAILYERIVYIIHEILPQMYKHHEDIDHDNEIGTDDHHVQVPIEYVAFEHELEQWYRLAYII